MADRCNFYFRQLVQEGELDLAFDQLEAADQNLASDIGLFGIVSGAEPIPHEPVPDLTIDLNAPGRSYDRLGQRVFFGTDQSVDCAVDYTGIPTEVNQSGHERWLGVFLKFDRLLSDPRTDGNSQQVYFRRDEHFQILVRQGAEAPSGSAQKVPLVEDEILVCDVRRTAGQTQIIEADIDLSRRQVFVFSTGSVVGVDPTDWEHISPAVNNVQSALDSIDSVFGDHFDGTNRHYAEHIRFSPVNYLESTEVQAAITELMIKLAERSAADAGSRRIGAREHTSTPISLPSGTVDSQIAALLGSMNDHLTSTGANHPASSITVADAGNRLSSNQVEGALQEILQGYEREHHRENQTHQGQHRTIRQPDLGSGRVLLFHSRGNGSEYAQFRIFADDTDIWFTVNANWSGSRWEKDTRYASGGMRFDRSNFRFLHHYHATDMNFTDWSNTYRIPMSATTNSAMELYGDDIQEIGRAGLRATNPLSYGATLSAGGTVTFRNRFPDTPSSISLTPLENSNWPNAPTPDRPDRDGFSYYSYQYLNSNVTGWWYGRYTAIA